MIGIMGIMGNCGMDKSTCLVRGRRRTVWVPCFNVSTYVLFNFYRFLLRRINYFERGKGEWYIDV